MIFFQQRLFSVLALFVLVGCAGKGGQIACEEGIDSSITTLSVSTLLRTYQGSASGRDLPRDARIEAARAAQNLFATGQRGQLALWRTFAPNFSGSFTIERLFQENDTPCLTYHQTVTFQDESRRSEGTACTDAQGFWFIVHEVPAWPHRSEHRKCSS